MLESPELQRFFQADTLAEAGRARREAYADAEPFPHAVIDGLFPKSIVEALPALIDPPDERWVRRERDTARKRGNPDEASMHPSLQAFLYKLNSGAFLRFLEEMTGIEPLIPDPWFHGGGIHQSERGGFLDIHADFNVHKRLGLDRRLNLLLYLNPDWPEAWGGHLELWDARMEHCVQKVLPVLNRCVVFSTTDTAFHGHPEPLTCPPGVWRKSLALYYYTVGRPESERSAPHSTLYQEPGRVPDTPPALDPAKRRIWQRLFRR